MTGNDHRVSGRGRLRWRRQSGAYLAGGRDRSTCVRKASTADQISGRDRSPIAVRGHVRGGGEMQMASSEPLTGVLH